MKIVCISDTHCRMHRVELPEGDILIHAGDLTFQGSIEEMSSELFKLGKHRSKYKHIIYVPGNHDWLTQRNPELTKQLCDDNGITYMCNYSMEIEGLKFYGSPITPWFHNWAWNVDRADIFRWWEMVPDNTQVLITHGPPMGILDHVLKYSPKHGEIINESVGCLDLYNRVMALKDLKLHVFGHIHSAAGTKQIGNAWFINASICTDNYRPTNKATIISI